MNRLISLIISLSLLCTCFICNISVGASEDVPTEYGTIPAQYADVSAYPVAVFKKDGTFLKASSIFTDNTSNCAMYWIRSDNSGNQGKYLLLRDDVTAGVYPNTHYHYSQENIIDLGGNTLTLTSNYLFSVIQRFARDINITFKNGTIIYPKSLISYSDSSSWTGTAKFNFTFEDITFRLSDASVSDRALIYGNAGSDPIETNIEFNDCTFDLSQKDLSTSTTLFGADLNAVGANIVVSGGKIEAYDSQNLIISATNPDEGSVVFTPDQNGNYTTLTLSSGSSSPDEIILTDVGDATYVLIDEEEESATYVLRSDSIFIPDIVVNRVIFNRDNGIEAYAVLRNMTDETKSAVMVLSGRNSDGTIVDVKCAEDEFDSVSQMSLISECDIAGVYFMEGWDSLLPLCNTLYTSDDSDSEHISSASPTGKEYLNISYDAESEMIIINGEGGAESGEALSLNIVSSEKGAPSSDNIPVISDLYFWNENGVLNTKIPVSDTIKSGKYTVYVRSQFMDAPLSAPVLIYRLDSKETTDALNEVNSQNNFDDFSASMESNCFSFGFDISEETDSQTFLKVLWGIKKSENGFTTNNINKAVNYARASTAIVNGSSADYVMQNYASSFDTTYEEYSSLNSATKEKLERLLKNCDFTNGYINYESVCSVAKASGCGSYEELRNLICDNADIYNIDLDGDYSKLSSSNKGKVFKKMYSECDSFNTIDDITDSFNDAVEYYLSSSQKSSSGSSGGGGKGSSRPVTVTSPIAQTNEQDNTSPDNTSQPEKVAPVYSDTENHFAKDDILYLSSVGIINGYSDGTFRPDGMVTRAELCKIVSVAFSIPDGSDSGFADVSEGEWYYDYVNALASASIVLGDGEKFCPADNVTREDCAVILSRIPTVQKLITNANYNFDDKESISEYAKSASESLASSGYMRGDGINFRPKDSISRGELAAVVARILRDLK